jgi:hypothetical protein
MALQKAMKKAQESGENTVVYLCQFGEKKMELIATATEWANCQNEKVEFLALVNADGNFVD